MKLNEEQKELYSLLVPRFGVLLSQEQVSKTLNISKVTLGRMRKQSIGISYIKNTSKGKNGEGSKILYPLQNVVRYLTENNVITY
ncbi:hypothetical protein [Arcobacter sp.]|uniref:hypothetical protein n=1 Tax=Arcobacter sp. TaxID=1872629 RepID=UPI003C723C0A